MLDSLILLRDGTVDLTVTEAPAGKMLSRGAKATLKVIVPAVTGTTPTLNIVVSDCDTLGGTYVAIHTVPQITATSTYYFTFTIDPKRPYVKAVPTVGGTTPNFGKTVIGVDVAGQYENL